MIDLENHRPKGGKLQEGERTRVLESSIDRRLIEVRKLMPNVTREYLKSLMMQDDNIETFFNAIYVAYVYRGSAADCMIHVPELKGRCAWISMKRKDKRPMNNWQDMQTIKNALVGIEWDAIQIYPRESRMVNLANQYHLICFPEDYYLPFGWINRMVDVENKIGGEGTTGQEFRGYQTMESSV